MPDNFGEWFLLLLSAVALTTLIWTHRRHRRDVKQGRASVYDDVLGRLENFRITQDDVDYPVLVGTYRGKQIELRLIADHVGYRKVPSLWLQLSVHAALPIQGVIDYLARPQNIEFYSPSADLPYSIPIPSHWPQHAILKTSDLQLSTSLNPLDDIIDLFDDASMKEVLVSPRGARLVWQVDQARRREYLVLRAVGFEHDRIDEQLLYSRLDRLLGLVHTLQMEHYESHRSHRSHRPERVQHGEATNDIHTPA